MLWNPVNLYVYIHADIDFQPKASTKIGTKIAIVIQKNDVRQNRRRRIRRIGREGKKLLEEGHIQQKHLLRNALNKLYIRIQTKLHKKLERCERD